MNVGSPVFTKLFLENLDTFLGDPSTVNERWLTLGLVVAVAGPVMSRFSTSLGAPMRGLLGGIGAAIIGGVLMIGVATFVSTKVSRSVVGADWFEPALVAGVSAVVVAPAISRLYASSWSRALITWGVGLLVAAGVVSLSSAAFDFLSTGIPWFENWVGEGRRV